MEVKKKDEATVRNEKEKKSDFVCENKIFITYNLRTPPFLLTLKRFLNKTLLLCSVANY